MALLVLVLSLLFFPASLEAHGEWTGEAQLGIFFDKGNPSNSVAIFNGQFLEQGDRIDSFEVLQFEPEAMILQDVRDGSPLKLPASGSIQAKNLVHGRYLFVVKQLRAIHEAQIQYERKFGQGYSLDLETLIHQGFLKDGFGDNYTKQGYQFSILKTGKTKPWALTYQNLPTYVAMAEPTMTFDGSQANYFSIDYLGEIRFAKSRESVSWGPVWEYSNILDEIEIRDLTVL